MGALTHNGEVMQGLPADASQINFNKTGTDLNSTQTENAIKEVNTKVNTNTADITQLKSGLTGQIITYENVTIAAGSKTWVTNLAQNKVCSCYAKNSDIIVYVAEAIESGSLQIYARNFGNDSVTTTIYLKEIG